MVDALRRRVMTVQGVVIVVGIAVLIIGLFVGLTVGRAVSALLLVSAAVYFLYRARRHALPKKVRKGLSREEAKQQPPEGPMKKLFFDDFQSPGGSYVVKEVQDGGSVVPSTRTVQPVVTVAKEEAAREFAVSDFFDLDSDLFRADAEPRSEFDFLLNKVLLALKEVLFAHSVAFFWANQEKEQMVLEAKATDSEGFMTSKRFPLGGDIVSQVAKNGKPQLLGSVNPSAEKELISYYESSPGIQSLIAAPVYYMRGGDDRRPVAVIVADSKVEDAFGNETVGWLGYFTKLVSALIKSYTDKYDLLLDSELLSSIRRLQDRIKSDPTEFTILNSLSDEANRLVNWDCLTVVMYSEERHGWMLHKVMNKSGQLYVGPDDLIDFEDSVVGQVIRSNKLESIDDLQAVPRVRFHHAERIESQGSFLCVPLSSLNRCYGALTLESKNRSNFTGIEVETIYRLAESAALTLEVLYMNDLVKDFVIVDHLTGAATKKHFLKKVEEEVRRAEDFGTDLSLVSVVIDGMEVLAKRHGKDGFDSIVSQIARIVRGNLRPYDVVGREDSDRLGIMLINTAASDAYLWAEKLRKHVSSYIITLAGKSFSVTVSAGVCGLTEGMQKEQLLAGTSRVLGKAIEGGGNLVQIF